MIGQPRACSQVERTAGKPQQTVAARLARGVARIIGGRIPRPFAVRAEIDRHSIGQRDHPGQVRAQTAPDGFKAGGRTIGRVKIGPPRVGQRHPAAQIEAVARIFQPSPATGLAGGLVFGCVCKGIGRERIAIEIDPAIGIARRDRGKEAFAQLQLSAQTQPPLAECIRLCAGGIGRNSIADDIAAGRGQRIAITLRAQCQIGTGRFVGTIFNPGAHAAEFGAGYRQHPANRIRSPRHRIRSAQQLNLTDPAGQQRAEIKPARWCGGIGHPHAIDHHHKLFRIGPAHEQAGLAAERPAARERHAGQAIQHAGQIGALDHLDFFGRDNADRLAGGNQQLTTTGSDHSDQIIGNWLTIDVGVGFRLISRTCVLRERRRGQTNRTTQ